MKKETPMMEQYHRIKKENRDSILLFRLGDFYEMFEEDAVAASGILNIALTKRNGIPMCGFPHHAADAYIVKFLKQGKKIAICEQREDPQLAKGIVKREVVEMISPGIITDPNLLNNKENNCIAALYRDETEGGFACASIDISTGEFVSTILQEKDFVDSLLNEIEDNRIREVIYPGSFKQQESILDYFDKIQKALSGFVMREVDDTLFDRLVSEEELKKQFSVPNTDVFEFQNPLTLHACGAVLSYIKENVRRDVSHIRWIREKGKEQILIIDNATKKHLELIESQIDGREYGTLLSILDKTQTAMGGRLLKRFISNPSRSLPEIRNRLKKVGYFHREKDCFAEARVFLKKVMDLERVVARLSVGKGNARDLIGLKNSLRGAGEIRRILKEIEIFSEETSGIGDFHSIIDRIDAAIVEDPPVSVMDGGIIRTGYDKKLDEFKKINQKNREWILNYQAEEIRKHTISSLKVKYNKIIGYYIEVTKPNLHLVPDYYIKKQTLVNAERFTTQELEEHETLLMEAREKSNRREYELYEETRKIVLDSMDQLFQAANAIAHIDVYSALAAVAEENNYTEPTMVEQSIIDIKDGRHPVIEKFGDEEFIENDLYLNETDQRLMILTGPNMAGKSTYLRQAALIIIMAHMGSFVPAKSATIGLVDRLFSRIGASDRLIKGESTFLVEMIETARILHYATPRSFIIMDEIGRGTSTYDGLAIAWAVLEYLLDTEKGGAKVLFATHYHELTALKDRYGVINYSATVREWNNSVIFLRKIVPGTVSKSYGIEVARLAGIPDAIIGRAKDILDMLETKYGSYMPLLLDEPEDEGQGQEKREKKPSPEPFKRSEENKLQLNLFPSPYDILAHELKGINVNEITPLEALNLLDRLKRSIST